MCDNNPKGEKTLGFGLIGGMLELDNANNLLFDVNTRVSLSPSAASVNLHSHRETSSGAKRFCFFNMNGLVSLIYLEARLTRAGL